jgi:sulfur-carrier protein
MKVLIPSPLLTYTGQSHVDAQGATLAEVLEDLDRQFPGLRFRVIDEQGRLRAHVRFFLNNGAVFNLSVPVQESDEIVIVQALSGG